MIKASLAILNANIITLNPKNPQAEAVAILNRKIIAVGSNKEISKYTNKKTKIVDTRGRAVLPGFTDCHVHMAGFGRLLQTLELRNAKSIKELQLKMRKYASENLEKKWILGGRWDQEKFAEKRYPTRWDLDKAVADKPVFLIRVCGHLGVANSKALQLAGIKKRTSVEGGKVDLDEESGEPNGILRENAMELVWKNISKPSLKELEETCALACRKAVETGLTCVHWMVDSAEEVRALRRLNNKRRLPLRVYLGIPVDLLDEITDLKQLADSENGKLRVGFIKILADGSLGAHTAALEKPYSDKPENKGIMLYPQKTLLKLVLRAHEKGLQLAVHAIGDRAIDNVLKAFENALKKHPQTAHRHRIEHCSILNMKLIRRMKRLKLVASVQPHFAVSDFWVKNRVGKDRIRYVYLFKTLIDEGLVVVSGSDCPVEPIDPLLGIWAAATKKKFTNENLTTEEAVKTYTVNAAYASFDEKNRGTIDIGKLADLTIISDDPNKIPTERIKNINVEAVVVDGKMVYRRKTF